MSSAPPYGSWLPPVAEPPVRSDGGDGRPVRWAPWTAVLALVTAFAFAIAGGIVVSLVGTAFGASFRDPPPAVNIVATFVQDAAFVGAALVYARSAGRAAAKRLGFVRTRLGQALGWMALAYVGYLVVGAAWAAIANTANQRDTLPTSLGVNQSTAALVAVCVIVTTIAPIAEETLFRGYIFGALRNWRGPVPAALITGVVFGAIHYHSAPNVYLPVLAVFGVALCLVRERTGSLLPCIALHALNNALAFAAAEHWTAGQTIFLAIGAVSVTQLVCAAVLARTPARA